VLLRCIVIYVEGAQWHSRRALQSTASQHRRLKSRFCGVPCAYEGSQILNPCTPSSSCRVDLHNSEGFQADLVAPDYKQRPRGFSSSKTVLAYRECQPPPPSESFRLEAKGTGGKCAECPSREDIPGIEELERSNPDHVRCQGGFRPRPFGSTGKKTERSKGTGASRPMDNRLLYR
jgi:hypothetical protein